MALNTIPTMVTSEEENIALSLMMLSRGTRQEPHEFFNKAAISEPYHLAHIPVGVASMQNPNFLHCHPSIEPVAAASQTPATVVAVAPSQPTSTAILPSLEPQRAPEHLLMPVVSVGQSLVLEPAVDPSQTFGLVIFHRQPLAPVPSSGQVHDPVVMVTHNKASTALKTKKASMASSKPKKSAKTVAAPTQAPNPEKAGSSQVMHECPVCGATFISSRRLNTHIKRHPDGRLHPCEFSERTFPSTSALQSHIKRSKVCGRNNPRKLGPVAAAVFAWYKIDLNMPAIP